MFRNARNWWTKRKWQGSKHYRIVRGFFFFVFFTECYQRDVHFLSCARYFHLFLRIKPPRLVWHRAPAHRSPCGGFKCRPRCPRYDGGSLLRRMGRVSEISTALQKNRRRPKLILSLPTGRTRGPSLPWHERNLQIWLYSGLFDIRSSCFSVAMRYRAITYRPVTKIVSDVVTKYVTRFDVSRPWISRSRRKVPARKDERREVSLSSQHPLLRKLLWAAKPENDLKQNRCVLRVYPRSRGPHQNVGRQLYDTGVTSSGEHWGISNEDMVDSPVGDSCRTP